MRSKLRLSVLAVLLLCLPFPLGGAQGLARLFIATSDGPYVSYSWGEYWETLRHRLPRSIRVWHCLGPKAFAGGTEGLFVSDDFGESWKEVESWEAGEVVSILTSLYFAAEPVIFVGTPNGLYRSRDGGEEEWERIAPDLIGGPVHAMNWPGPSLFVAASQGLFQTDDGGDSWQRVGDGLPAVPVLSLTLSRFFGVEPIIFVGLDGAGVYRSRDGGKRFEPVGGSAWAKRHVPAIYWWGSSLFAGTDEGLFVSHDAGDNWESASEELEGEEILSLSIPAPEAPGGSDVLVGTKRGVFKTSDGAITWRHMTSGMDTAVIYGFGSFPFVPESADPERKK
jgi:photosystem II stability/assembly factor-like uncharacterized protein